MGCSYTGWTSGTFQSSWLESWRLVSVAWSRIWVIRGRCWNRHSPGRSCSCSHRWIVCIYCRRDTEPRDMGLQWALLAVGRLGLEGRKPSLWLRWFENTQFTCHLNYYFIYIITFSSIVYISFCLYVWNTCLFFGLWLDFFVYIIKVLARLLLLLVWCVNITRFSSSVYVYVISMYSFTCCF